MLKQRRLILIAVLITLAGLTLIASAQQPYRLPDREMKPLLERVEKGVNQFRDALRRGLRNSRLDLGRGEQSIYQYVEDLRVSTRRLKDRYNGRRSVAADVEEVLRRAAYVDRFMQRHPLVTHADREWTELRRNLDTLAQAYNVAWQWDGPAGRPYRLNDQELKALLERIKYGTDQFRNSLNQALKDERAIDRQSRDNINQTLKDFAQAADRLKDRVGDSKSVAGDAEELLRWASTIDRFMARHRLARRAQSDWMNLYRHLEELARAYNISWNG